MIDLKIGGVPEHFNYPWYLTLKNKEYQPYGINLRWTDFPGGTGDMCKALRTKDIDIAIVLTEGIIKDITEGNPSKILQTYVETPLIWGIHVSAERNFQSISDLKNKRIAISRIGSGSHLMAVVNAYNQGWNADALEYVVVNDLQGGVEALKNNKADYFLWEHFTTKPFVDEGILKRVGNCPTPWPCFVIAVREQILEEYPKEISNILKVINQQNQNFREIDKLEQILAERYQQRVEDIQRWLDITRWNTGNSITSKFISELQNKLLQFNVIYKKKKPEEFIKNMYF